MIAALGHLLFWADVIARAGLTLALLVALLRFSFGRRGGLIQVVGILGAVALLTLLDQGSLPGLLSTFVNSLQSSGQGGTVQGFMPGAK